MSAEEEGKSMGSRAAYVYYYCGILLYFLRGMRSGRGARWEGRAT